MKIGIDLGGTKIECVVISQDNHIIFRERLPTPKGDYLGILDSIESLVNKTLPYAPHNTPIGIGIPGTLSSDTGTIKNANTTCLIGEPLDQDLAVMLNRPIKLANDANCFIWSEFCDGAAKGKTNAFGVIIGTGVGGGLVVNHQLVNGLNGIAGEWGHNPLPHFGLEQRPCYCSKEDCVETYLSGPAFEKSFLDASPQTTATSVGSEEIVSLARIGDPLAKQHLDNYAKMLAASLTSVINIVDPDIIVLGGGMSNIDELYELVPKYLQEYVFSDTIHTPIVKAKHGDSSGVRGAAWLWNE
ncbi:ROK family protein [Litoribrevibacter albus]|uniref:Fructokinase n=1 Tax=Litoribrevibacter albus TaxID=1473156 RepID=A0AA37W6U2_9GAMM|nr:ROK family protein [Litoribrevibacter albus]GLQ31945.1 fructokinase [Litoribrevibacter albus]